jgi:hypothetical protein
LDAEEEKDGGDASGDSSGQWRQQNWKISKDQIAEALEYEAAEFGLDGPPVVNEAQDASETLAEEREASSASGNGRVRRDKYQMVRRIPLSKRRATEREPGCQNSENSTNGTSSIEAPSSALKESSAPESSVASEYSSRIRGDMFNVLVGFLAAPKMSRNHRTNRHGRLSSRSSPN